jgi:predicted ATPase
VRLARLRLRNFKAFDTFVVEFGSNAFLVGPNNAGKSTLIEAIRIGSGMIRDATRVRPSVYKYYDSKRLWTYPLRSELLGEETENVRHKLRRDEVRLSITLDNALGVEAIWPSLDDDGEETEAPFFHVSQPGYSFKAQRPNTLRGLVSPIGIVPTLAPVPHDEEELASDYVERYAGTPRASQHLRNHIWQIQQSGSLNEFRQWIVENLPEIEQLEVARRPGQRPGRSELDLFYSELGDRSLREVSWAGDGVQIYLQILTHLWRLRSCEIIVLDEPDVFLHADLQRRLVRLLEGLEAQCITATHSPEMLGEASQDSVIWVDKSRRRAVRRPDAASMEDLSTQIGSQYNLRLAAALRSRTILFVEGRDMAVLRRIAKRVGATRLALESNCTIIEMHGFERWEHVEPFHWLLRDFLSHTVTVFVVLDRDYRLDDEVDAVIGRLEGAAVRPHVWRRKELESYLLEPGALARLSGLGISEVVAELNDVTSAMSAACQSQLLASYQRFYVARREDPAPALQRGLTELDPYLRDPTWRLHRFPPKQVLAAFNDRLQRRGLKAVSIPRLAAELRRGEIDDEMASLLLDVEATLR